MEALSQLMEEGLAEEVFWDSFVQCAKCSHVFPTSLYPYAHRCSKKAKIPGDALRPEEIDFVDTDNEEEDEREEREEEEVDRQLDALRSAMYPHYSHQRRSASSL
jgi:hypothetical protein